MSENAPFESLLNLNISAFNTLKKEWYRVYCKGGE